jgi:hypothetical protein
MEGESMDDEFERLTRIGARRGIFGEYNVDGLQYKNSSDVTGWQISAWHEHGSISCYWVEKGKFYGVKINIFPNFLNEIQYEKLGEVTEISETEKEAVLRAIAQWENI